jgi:hypothetical protein
MMIPRCLLNIEAASIVLSLPPLKPTSHGRGSSKYNCLRESVRFALDAMPSMLIEVSN